MQRRPCCHRVCLHLTTPVPLESDRHHPSDQQLPERLGFKRRRSGATSISTGVWGDGRSKCLLSDSGPKAVSFFECQRMGRFSTSATRGPHPASPSGAVDEQSGEVRSRSPTDSSWSAREPFLAGDLYLFTIRPTSRNPPSRDGESVWINGRLVDNSKRGTLNHG